MIQYDGGAQLNHASFDALADVVRFYLAWTKSADDTLAYSIQLIDDGGSKTLQVDHVIRGELLTVHELEYRRAR